MYMYIELQSELQILEEDTQKKEKQYSKVWDTHVDMCMYCIYQYSMCFPLPLLIFTCCIIKLSMVDSPVVNNELPTEVVQTITDY